MENTSAYSQKFLRKRRFLLVLPLLALPFITMAFWALGGGGTGKNSRSASGGLNLSLPKALLQEDKDLTKMSYYEKAEEDSAARLRASRNDGAYRQPATDSAPAPSYASYSYDPSPPGLPGYKDSNEEKVYRKLEQLNRQLSSLPAEKTGPQEDSRNDLKTAIGNDDLDRLEFLAQMMEEGKGQDDPEMRELHALMEKILDIQHPERVKERLAASRQQPKKRTTSPSLMENEGMTTLLEASGNQPGAWRERRGSAFYGLDDNNEGKAGYAPAVEAVVDQTAVVTDGATIKLRLADNLKAGDVLIPRGTPVCGTASLEGERLLVSIKSVRYQSAIFPLSLSVYDLDGIEGIYIPGSVSKEALRESTAESIESLRLGTFEPSLKGQAADAAVQSLKSLFRKKRGAVKVTLREGYRVLLQEKEL